MTRRPKDIGTAAETAVVRYLRDNGWPHAERRALHGNTDLGDLTGMPGLCVEVKGGDAAKVASDLQILDWLAETEIERYNARADHGILITARHRKAVGAWWAHMSSLGLADLMGAPWSDLAYKPSVPVRLRLGDLVAILHNAGYGTKTQAVA